MAEDGYLLDNAETAAGVRLEALAAVFDPATFRHLSDLGTGPGWRCWEVGAGGPSVPRWLGERVAPGGRVLATDLDVTWTAAAAGSLVEVRRHAVVAEPPPEDGFDLIHARLLLVHLPEREQVLSSLVAALRPGGWLLVEDADPALQPRSALDPRGPEDELANRVRDGLRTLLAGRQADLAFGRRLPGMLRAAGLADVAADAWFPVSLPACAALETATVRMIGPRLEAAGLVTAEELASHLEAVAAGRLDLAQPPLVSAWGRRSG